MPRLPNPNPNLTLTLTLIKVCPVFGINVLAFILLFLLIDRTDESQLVRYTLNLDLVLALALALALALMPSRVASPVDDAAERALASLSCRRRAPSDSDAT